MKTLLLYNPCKTKIDQICCICLHGTEGAGSLRSRTQGGGGFSEPLQGDECPYDSSHPTQQVKEIRWVVSVNWKDLLAWCTHRETAAWPSSVSWIWKDFTHPGEPLLIHKGRQLVLPFAVDYDTYSSSTLSLTVKLFQSGGISVTAITSKVSCGCLPSGHVSLLWWS